VNQLAESIRAFGFTNPVLLDQSDMVIAGHGRVAAAKQLKMLEVPTIRLDSLTPDQVRAYVLADNKLAELAGWDTEILAIELQYLTALEGDFELTVTGFEIPEIDLLLSPQESIPDREDEIQDQGNSPAVARPGRSDDAKKQTGNYQAALSVFSVPVKEIGGGLQFGARVKLDEQKFGLVRCHVRRQENPAESGLAAGQPVRYGDDKLHGGLEEVSELVGPMNAPAERLASPGSGRMTAKPYLIGQGRVPTIQS
jgi:hypothetical protein